MIDFWLITITKTQTKLLTCSHVKIKRQDFQSTGFMGFGISLLIQKTPDVKKWANWLTTFKPDQEAKAMQFVNKLQHEIIPIGKLHTSCIRSTNNILKLLQNLKIVLYNDWNKETKIISFIIWCSWPTCWATSKIDGLLCCWKCWK